MKSSKIHNIIAFILFLVFLQGCTSTNSTNNNIRKSIDTSISYTPNKEIIKMRELKPVKLEEVENGFLLEKKYAINIFYNIKSYELYIEELEQKIEQLEK